MCVCVCVCACTIKVLIRINNTVYTAPIIPCRISDKNIWSGYYTIIVFKKLSSSFHKSLVTYLFYKANAIRIPIINYNIFNLDAIGLKIQIQYTVIILLWKNGKLFDI